MHKTRNGFTVVELIIVIVVIAILAVISTVAYNGIQSRTRSAAVAHKEEQAKKKLELYKVDHDEYPHDQATFNALIGQNAGDKPYVYYESDPPYDTYSLTTSTDETAPVVNGSYMQTITSTNCPTSRKRVVDARDNRTYWVQKLADGKCWMLTNLAYGGGGTNTYNDVKILSNGTSEGSTTYTEAKYYITASANATTSPANPSTSTTGTGQYGYHYNWCAAMGVQTGTAACANASTPTPNAAESICPSGWRLPTSKSDGELPALASAIGADSNSFRTTWLGQYGGWRINISPTNQGTTGVYWSATTYNSSSPYVLVLQSAAVNPSASNYLGKSGGGSVRCLAL